MPHEAPKNSRYNDETVLFSRYAPFIRDFIYENGWESLRKVQREAAGVLFDSEENLLLCSATASGKTEAAFFPILTLLCEKPSLSFGVLYIAPLKSLINDQFSRMEQLLRMSDLPLFHWHGDVAASHKTKALKEPRGILQITPESLESMLINRKNDIPRLFGDLRFIVLDELHSVMNSDRGRQIACQIARLDRLLGFHPRRVGLSATLGDKAAAAEFLGAGSGRETAYTSSGEDKPAWRLGIAHFFIQNDHFNQVVQNPSVVADTEASDGGRLLPPSVSGAPPHGEELPEEIAPAYPAVEYPAGYEDLQALMEKQSALRSGSALRGGLPGKAAFDPGYEYLYESSRNRACLLFSNSREETEYVTATLRQIADAKGEEDRFLIHHGNLSAALREETETKLKNGNGKKYVACATVTLELGIDIGVLERILHNGAPNSVSGFLQRLGRSGRRGAPPEMVMVLREETPLPNAPLPKLIPWELLRAIAVIQLYAEERFIEPAGGKKMPLSLLFQQTLSTLASSGELTPAALAGRILTLPPFAEVPREIYRTLLSSMLEGDYLEVTEEGGLIVGLKGEKLTNSFHFYATFKDSEDFTVRNGADEIGTVSSAPPVGDRFALAGKVWEVEEFDLARHLIFVHPVKGKMEICWPGDFGEIHTKILKRMRQALEEDTVYPYLLPGAAARLQAARRVARATGMLKHSLVRLGGYSYCLFPWLGTKAFRTLRRILKKYADSFGISGVEFEGCCYICFKMERANEQTLPGRLLALIGSDGLDPRTLVGESESPAYDKYDEYLPPSLLREAFAADRLAPKEALARLEEIADEAGRI